MLNMLSKKISKRTWLQVFSVLALVFCYVGLAFADTPAPAGTSSIGGVATQIATNFSAMGKMMVGIAYLAGFGFAIAAIFKFKQHKDNPTQIPIGTPIALLVIGIVLIFLPGIIKVGGGTAGFSDTGAGGFTGEGVKNVPGGNT